MALEIPGPYSRRRGGAGSPNGLLGASLVALAGRGDAKIDTPVLQRVVFAQDNASLESHQPLLGPAVFTALGGPGSFAVGVHTLSATYENAATVTEQVPAVEISLTAIVTDNQLSMVITLPTGAAAKIGAEVKVYSRFAGADYAIISSLLATFTILTSDVITLTFNVIGGVFPTVAPFLADAGSIGGVLVLGPAAGAPPIFHYRVAAISEAEGEVVLDLLISPLRGETLPSNIKTTSTRTPSVASNVIDLAWNLVQGALFYKIYRDTEISAAAVPTFTSPALLATVTGGTTTSYRDTMQNVGAGTPVTAPAVSTAFVSLFNKPATYFSGNAVRDDFGISTPIGLAATIADRLNLSRMMVVSIDSTGIDALGPAPTLVALQAAKQIAFQAAFETLENFELDILVPLDPFLDVNTAALQHVQDMSSMEERKERMLYAASLSEEESADPTAEFPEDFIGDTVTANSIVFNARQVFNSPRATLFSPNSPFLTYVDEAGNVLAEQKLDGSFNAAMWAFVKSVLGDPSEDVIGRLYTIFDKFGTAYLESQQRFLISNGVTPLFSTGGRQRAVNFITTSIATKEDANPNIQLMDDAMIKSLRNDVFPYIGRKITRLLLDAIFETVGKRLDQLIAASQITSYIGLDVYQDDINRDFVIVRFSYTPVYSARVIFFDYGFDLRTGAALRR